MYLLATEMSQKERKIHWFVLRHQRNERWKVDRRASKFPAELEKPYIDKDASLSWLKKGILMDLQTIKGSPEEVQLCAIKGTISIHKKIYILYAKFLGN